MNNRREFLAGALAVASSAKAQSYSPAPFGVVPSPAQIAWSELEYYNFLHFTVNTFTDREWGEGDEDPSIFNPTAFDAGAIIAALKNSGSKGVILTCKHHDGFCLWPTATTEHSIRKSPYKSGNGDIVREISDAARRAGLKFGVYLSPWDRNNAAYGKTEYLKIYRAQMRELLTNYGPIFEIWHDGANGGSGFYGGAKETRTIDKLHYYDWPGTWRLERELQPNAAIFSDVGPDVRWVGNEKGIAGETCWATFTARSPRGGPGSPGDVVEAQSTTGTRNGERWIPAECDVSIRPGWFYHAKEDGQVRTVRNLLDLYYQSVGRGASFLLNVPPDRRGLLAQPDVASLAGFGQALEATFAKNLATKAKVTASHTRGKSKQYGAKNLLDGRRNTYWATNDGQKTAAVAFDFQTPITFNVVRIREYTPLGQRISAFRVATSTGGDMSEFGRGASIGLCRILRMERPVTATRVELQITDADACPALSEFGLYLERMTTKR